MIVFLDCCKSFSFKQFYNDKRDYMKANMKNRRNSSNFDDI